MFTKVNVSAVSIRPKKWAKAHNADKIETFVREAAKDKPDIIVTTEGVLEGYVVMDVIDDPSRTAEMIEIAEPIDGPYISRFQTLARELKVCLCLGFAERMGNEVYNTAIFLDSKGKICGKYHKMMLAEGTTANWRFNRVGKVLRAFNTPFGRVGIMICNDRWNPMIARSLVLDGACLLLIPSYGSKAKEQNDTVLARARENGVPIAEANSGMNLIISKGEIVAYKWGHDQITTAIVDVPQTPSMAAARALEAEYLALQGPEMSRRYSETVKRLKGKSNLTHLAARGTLIANEPEHPTC